MQASPGTASSLPRLWVSTGCWRQRLLPCFLLTRPPGLFRKRSEHARGLEQAFWLSLLPLMWSPCSVGFTGLKLFFNFQMPWTSCILERGTLELSELLQEVLRGFISSVSQTCDVDESFAFFAQYPNAFWTSISTFSSTCHHLCSLLSEPPLLLRQPKVHPLKVFIDSFPITSSTNNCFNSSLLATLEIWMFKWKQTFSE